jgi:ubiquinone/menaquinone biosynthesis C-methylase UbiE
VTLYERHLLPRLVEWACRSRSLERVRRRVVARAQGRVLEIGFGSGLNLRHYDRGRVGSILALEPNPGLRRLAAQRVRDSGLSVEFIDASAEAIPLPDASVDTIVVTFTLCTIPDPQRAAREMRRVLRPDGRLLFAEHGRAEGARALRWQRRIEPVWMPLAGGCHLTRDPTAILRDAGFEVTAERGCLNEDVPVLRAIGPLMQGYWGVART